MLNDMFQRQVMPCTLMPCSSSETLARSCGIRAHWLYCLQAPAIRPNNHCHHLATRSPLRDSCWQARRLESQLYQRAQDQRTIEVTQRQVQLARAQVHQLEQHHLEQAARISQGAKSLQRLQDLIRESLQTNNDSLCACEQLERDVTTMRDVLEREAPGELAKVQLSCEKSLPTHMLRSRAQALERALADTERTALQQIGATPLQSVAMSCDCNPLNDLSAVADYASKASIGAREGAAGALRVFSGADAPLSAAAYVPAPACAPNSYSSGLPTSPSTCSSSGLSPNLSSLQPMLLSRDPSLQPMSLSRESSFEHRRVS